MTDYVERQLDLPAPPRVVWRFLFDPELLGQWLADEVMLDPTPGGEASFRIGDELRSGWVEQVSPPVHDQDGAELTFWWSREAETASHVRVTLTPGDDGHTRLRIVETRPLELLDLVGIPQPGEGHTSRGPLMLATAG